jgi:hypothetical protein
VGGACAARLFQSQTKTFLVGVVFWVLWNTRNKLVIEGVCPRTPSDVMHKILSFVQRWRVLLGGENQSKLDVKATQVRAWLERFRPIPGTAEDLL